MKNLELEKLIADGIVKVCGNKLELENRFDELERARVSFEEILKDYDVKTEYTRNTLKIECEGDSSVVRRICEVSLIWNELEERYVFKIYRKLIINGKRTYSSLLDASNEEELKNTLVVCLL